VIDILKSMVTDEDVLEKEDMYIMDRIKNFASTVEKEVVPPTLAAKQLCVLVDRIVSVVFKYLLVPSSLTFHLC
jgi:son of sevenless-like protein